MNAAVLHTLNQPPLFQQFPEPVAEEKRGDRSRSGRGAQTRR